MRYVPTLCTHAVYPLYVPIMCTHAVYRLTTAHTPPVMNAVNEGTHSHTHAHCHIHTHMHTHAHSHTLTHTLTHTHTHTHAHTHTHTHSHPPARALSQEKRMEGVPFFRVPAGLEPALRDGEVSEYPNLEALLNLSNYSVYWCAPTRLSVCFCVCV